MSLPRKLKNFILFNDGVGYLGEVPSVTLPKLTRKTEEYRGGGMGGPIELDMGMEKLTLSWTAAGYLKDVLKQFGTAQHNGVLLRFAGAIQADDALIASPLEVTVRGRHKEIDFGTSEAGKATEIKIETVLSYYKLSIDSEVVIELDFVNMIERINGENRLDTLMAALGVA
jgi:P2 family phage contractile tail tube protein